MSDENQNIIEEKEIVTDGAEVAVSSIPVATPAKPHFDDRRGGDRRGSSSRGKNDRKPRREPRAKPEFDQKIIDIIRVTRVSSGGRRFSFSVSLVVGNHKGMVGVATGKAGDTALAIEKAYRRAKKDAVKINLCEDMTIPHAAKSKFKSATVFLSRAPGKGIVAGSSVRDVVELAGIKDINTKLHSASKNKLNIAKASIRALLSLKKPKVSKKSLEK